MGHAVALVGGARVGAGTIDLIANQNGPSSPPWQDSPPVTFTFVFAKTDRFQLSGEDQLMAVFNR